MSFFYTVLYLAYIYGSAGCVVTKLNTVHVCSVAKSNGDILQILRKIHPSSDSRNPSCWRLCGLVQLGTLHVHACIIKIFSSRQKNCMQRLRLSMEDL